MAHRIYHTLAFVLASQPSGETGRSFWFFSEDLGLVIAEARAVREVKSKLRYHLTTGSLVRISLVRGKDRWRLTGAETERVLLNEQRRSWVSVLELVRSTFVSGHPEPGVFSELLAAFSWVFAQKDKLFSLDSFRIVSMFRVLALLGSVDRNVLPKVFDFDWRDGDRLDEIPKKDIQLALREIRRALAVL